MFCKITLLKTDLSENEILQIIEKNNLQYSYNSITKTKTFSNQNIKKLTGGMLIKITDTTLKIEGSIHKFFNFLIDRRLENFNVFTMQDFLKTLETMFKVYHLPTDGYVVKSYEIGLNVYLSENEEQNDFLKKVQSIGKLDGTQRKIYTNPRYKNETMQTTQMHKDNTVVYRMYDKNQERTDKGKQTKISPCIRIETLRTRIKDLPLQKLCSSLYLLGLQEKFIKEWQRLNFDKEIEAPKGTHQSKKELAKMILFDGTNEALKLLEAKRNTLTSKIYRTSKEFIKNWDNVKDNFSLIDTEIMPKWANNYNTAIQQLTKNTIKN